MITLSACLFSSLHGICIESAHFQDRRFCIASGCLRYRVSLLVFFGGFFLLSYVRGRVRERFFGAELYRLSWCGCAMPGEYVTVFFLCLLSSLCQYGGARGGFLDTLSTCVDPVFFSDVELC